jgi:anti-sigma factor RsiW
MLNQGCPLRWEMLSAYVDGEFHHFSPSAPWGHITGCPTCLEACAQIRDQNKLIRSLAPYYAASRSLRNSVIEAVRL